MANFCAACGHALEPGARFCPNCGAAVQATVPGPPAQTASAPATVRRGRGGQKWAVAIAILGAIIILPWLFLRDQVSLVFIRGRHAVMGGPCSFSGDESAPNPVGADERVRRIREALKAHFPETSFIQGYRYFPIGVIHPRRFPPGGVQTWVTVLMGEGTKDSVELFVRKYKEKCELMLSGKEVRTLPRGPNLRGEDAQLERGERVRLDSRQGASWEGVVAVRNPDSPSSQAEPYTVLYPIGVAYGTFMCSDIDMAVWQRRASDRASEQFGSPQEMRAWATAANVQAKTEVVALMQRLASGLVAQKVCAQ